MVSEESVIGLLHLSDEDQDLFSIRQSKKAKRLIFKSSVKKGLELVLPRLYDDQWVMDVVERRKCWIRSRISDLRADRALLIPENVTLDSAGLMWNISYLTPGDEGVEETGTGNLLVTSNSADVFSASRVLQQWLQLKAVDHLFPLLEEISFRLGISYNRVTVRGQKTRWGSCSEKKNISLNRNLLFMPPAIVKYVIHHELVHVRVLDHSFQFWKELEEVLPSSQLLRKELRRLEKNVVPIWASV